MGNASRRKPNARGGSGAPRPAPPRFAVVRTEVDEIKIVNVEHVTLARFTLLPGGVPFLALETIADNFAACFEGRGGVFDPERFSGKHAIDLAAHLILCGVDVEGAAEALAAARGDVYASYFPAAALAEPGGLGGLPDPDEAAPDCCSGCAFETDERCDGWIPGGLDDACGAFEMIPTAEEEIGQTRQSTIADAGARFDEEGGGCACLTPPPPPPPALFPNGIAPPPTTYDTDGIRAGCDCPTCRAPAPPALALGELRAGEVDRQVGDVSRFADVAEETRASCSFGAKCERFPACADCSLYALADRTEPADPRHVEQVTGEHRDDLAERVGRCGVFLGLQARGAEIGKQWCNVGHEMTDPACALCPYLRIASR